MIKLNPALKPEDFSPILKTFWQLSGEKILSIENEYDVTKGSPVFTRAGKYTTRGWTEWTQGFQFGSALLQFDAVGDEQFLNYGRENTLKKMAPHLSHIGVHDHGFNNVSTYGNLLRLIIEGKVKDNNYEAELYRLALKVSGAVQASRWTHTNDGGGFIHSFNGPHSLFVDTIRSCRSLVLSHLLGHYLPTENDQNINLLHRAVEHIEATARYAVYYGEGRDTYDTWGRTAHESIFNTKDGQYRCPNSQQGYTGFSTWTRGLAWAMCGFAEQLELFSLLPNDSFKNKTQTIGLMEKAAEATCDFYIEHTPTDGIPYWDTGAPNLHKIGLYLAKPADPFNDFEPIDSTAAAIGVQGLFRLSNYFSQKGQKDKAEKYQTAALSIMRTLLSDVYLSHDKNHQGLLLHSIYHQPNGWDYVPEGSNIPYGESSMWGDYHLREAALYLQKIINQEKYYTFFNCIAELPSS